MASKEVEVLDPALTVEKVKKSASERVLNRRHFIAALGVAGAAVAGTELVRSGPTALAQQPKPNGYAQNDVLNFLLNVKYLKATLYSYVTQGTDLVPTAANPNVPILNLGTGGVFNAPAKITFSGTGSATTQQITDLFNEMYYDELNQLVALRGLLGAAVLPRATMNMLGTGVTTTTTTTMTQPQFIGYARLLEDLSASAFAGATVYLSGTNLEYVTQALAVNGFHAGAVRLVAIQTGAYYYSGQEITTGTAGAGSLDSFSASTVVGSPIVYNLAPTNAIVAGTTVSGPGIPVDTVISSVNLPPVFTGSLAGTAAAPNNTITNLSTTTGLQVGQALSGTGIPANAVITNISGSTITIGVITGYSALTPPTPILNGLMGVTVALAGVGMTVGGPIPLVFSNSPGTGAAGTLTVLTPTTVSITMTNLGSGYTTAPTVTAATGGTPPTLAALVAGQITTTATATLTPGFTATVTKGSTGLINVSQTAGLVPGQLITGTGVPSLGVIAQGGISAAAGTVVMSAVASASSTVAPTGIVTNGSAVITGVSSVGSVLLGVPITGTGIQAGALVTSFDPNALTITMSKPATATSVTTTKPTGVTTIGSNVITALNSLSGLASGQPISGTGIPANTFIGSVGGVNTLTLVNSTNAPQNATATTVPVTVMTTAALLASGNNIVNSVYPITGLASGQLITDTLGNIPIGTTITGVTASTFTITMSTPAVGSTTVTPISSFTGTVVVSYETLSSIPPAAFTTTPPIAVGMPISGTNIPSGTIITALSAANGTITISQFPTAAAGAEVTANSNPPAAFVVTTTQTLTAATVTTFTTTSPTETVTMQTLVTVTPSLGSVTLSQNATATAGTTLTFLTSDPMDVEPNDPGTAALAAAGPAALAGTSPTVYQGFFDTAGGATSSANNPAGAVFARTFSQVLAVLYGSTTAQTYQGGFYPNGVAGGINNV